MEALIAAVTAVLVALTTLVYSIINNRKRATDTANTDGKVDHLKSRIEALERDLRSCHEKRDELTRENIELMRRLVAKP